MTDTNDCMSKNPGEEKRLKKERLVLLKRAIRNKPKASVSFLMEELEGKLGLSAVGWLNLYNDNIRK